MTTDIIDRINARAEARRASDRELARITGQTVEDYDADVTAPDPRDDESYTLAEFCTIFLHLPADNMTRQAFTRRIEDKWDRLEAQGKDVRLRMSRFAWYADWKAFEIADEQATQLDARYVGLPY